MTYLSLWMLVSLVWPVVVWGHARLMSPPSRSSMWRLGFPTEKNYDDDGLYCGGYHVQWQRNGGKCGICGDPFDMPHPRDNEAGGKYGRGIISKRYLSGQIIEATIDVTTNHKGYFEFRLCPNNNPKKEVTQGCLDKHLLREARGMGTKYDVGDLGEGNITVHLQLPKGIICSQCVFQWTYVAGNNWGACVDGESKLGCGPQETFRGCADIAIEKSSDGFNYKPNINDVRGKSIIKKQRLSYDSKYPENISEASKQVRRNNRTRQKYPESNTKPPHDKRYHNESGEYSGPSPATGQETSGGKATSFENRHQNESGSPTFRYRGYDHQRGEYFPNLWRYPSLEALKYDRLSVGKKYKNGSRPRGVYHVYRTDHFGGSDGSEEEQNNFNLVGKRYNDF